MNHFSHLRPLSREQTNRVCLSVFQVDQTGPSILLYGAAGVTDMCQFPLTNIQSDPIKTDAWESVPLPFSRSDGMAVGWSIYIQSPIEESGLYQGVPPQQNIFCLVYCLRYVPPPGSLVWHNFKDYTCRAFCRLPHVWQPIKVNRLLETSREMHDRTCL